MPRRYRVFFGKVPKSDIEVPPLHHRNKNHFSALSAPDLLTADLQKQLQHDRLTKVELDSESQFVCSPLGLVPKHDGGWRRIHDLSFPHGHSINDGIPQSWGALEYTTFDEAVDALLQQGQGALLVKRDLKDAFRHIPVAFSDQHLLGFFCDNSYWLERFLPFGLRTSPFLFDLFAKGVNWVLFAVLHWSVVLHYLDDFFAILPSWADAEAYGRQFDKLCDDLGLTVTHTKDILGTIADFLGIELDSTLMQARLPPDKLERARRTVADLLKRATIPHRELESGELESAVGFLSFAAKIVVPGRAFLRSLFEAIRRPVAIIRLSADMKADLLWWKTFLKDWNGLKLLRLVADRDSWYIWTDASGKLGMGGYILKHPDLLQHVQDVFSTRVPSRHARKDIQFKEMTAILHAIRLWIGKLHGTRLVLHCDNEDCVHGLRKSTMRGPAKAPLRKIAMLIASHDILLIPTWIPTKANQLADDLSRFRYRKIADRFPQLNHLPRHHPSTPPLARPTNMVVQSSLTTARSCPTSLVGVGPENPSNLFNSNQVLQYSLCSEWHQSFLSSYILLLNRLGRVVDCQEGQGKVHQGILTGVKSAHVDMGFEDLSVFHSPRPKRIIDGSRRLRGEIDTQERRPVTKDVF